MTKAKAVRRPWTRAEVRILKKNYPSLGATGCLPLLPRRSVNSIRTKVRLLDLIHVAHNHRGLTSPVAVEDLPRLLAMHTAGHSLDAIGAAFSISAASAANALAAAKCRAAGRAPAKRASDGSLMIRDLKRLHGMLHAGARGVDIQSEFGISASSVSTHRRRLNAELAAKGMPALPAPGAGQRYSGTRLSAADIKAAESLYMEGFGTKTVRDRLGIGGTGAKRIRARLIARLARKGECLPGCDAAGRRIKLKEPARKIPAAAIEKLRVYLLDRMPVRRAARFTGIGVSSAYKIRDALAAELDAQGKALPKPKLPGKSAAGRAKAPAVPAPSRKLTFEEQLQLVREGASIAPKFIPSRVINHTLGGVGSGML